MSSLITCWGGSTGGARPHGAGRRSRPLRRVGDLRCIGKGTIVPLPSTLLRGHQPRRHHRPLALGKAAPGQVRRHHERRAFSWTSGGFAATAAASETDTFPAATASTSAGAPSARTFFACWTARRLLPPTFAASEAVKVLCEFAQFFFGCPGPSVVTSPASTMSRCPAVRCPARGRRASPPPSPARPPPATCAPNACMTARRQGPAVPIKGGRCGILRCALAGGHGREGRRMGGGDADRGRAGEGRPCISAGAFPISYPTLRSPRMRCRIHYFPFLSVPFRA